MTDFVKNITKFQEKRWDFPTICSLNYTDQVFELKEKVALRLCNEPRTSEQFHLVAGRQVTEGPICRKGVQRSLSHVAQSLFFRQQFRAP